jgi:hypothetical protein
MIATLSLVISQADTGYWPHFRFIVPPYYCMSCRRHRLLPPFSCAIRCFRHAAISFDIDGCYYLRHHHTPHDTPAFTCQRRRWHYFRAEQRQLPADIAARYAAAAIASRLAAADAMMAITPLRHCCRYASRQHTAEPPDRITAGQIAGIIFAG